IEQLEQAARRAHQCKAARKPRRFVKDGKGMRDICGEFFDQQDKNQNWKKLWKQFPRFLDDRGVQIKDKGNCYAYFDAKRRPAAIADATFRSYLSRFRN